MIVIVKNHVRVNFPDRGRALPRHWQHNTTNMNNNSFYNESIDFYIEKPGAWEFLPTSWAVNIRNKQAVTNEEIGHLLKQANQPFVYMFKRLERNDMAFPTAQATCRYFEYPTDAKLEKLLHLQVQTMAGTFLNFHLLHSSTSALASDCRAIHLHASFSLKNDQGMTMECVTRSWSIFHGNIMYTLGMSGPYGEEDSYATDHEFILNSVLIGKRT